MTIHLAHFSVKQYILCNMPAQGGLLMANERLRASSEAFQSNILAKLCLRYLNFRMRGKNLSSCRAVQSNGHSETMPRDHGITILERVVQTTKKSLNSLMNSLALITGTGSHGKFGSTLMTTNQRCLNLKEKLLRLTHYSTCHFLGFETLLYTSLKKRNWA